MKKLILGICVFALTGALQAQEVVKIVASTNSGKNMLQVFTAEGEEKEVIKKDSEFNQALLAKLVELKKAGFTQKSFEVIVYPYQTTGLGGSVTSATYLTSREEIFYYWKE